MEIDDAFEYEAFVQSLYWAVQEAEKLSTNLTTLSFERNKRIRNRYGADREFDVYWKYELDGIVKQTIIECKNYNSTIKIEKLDALVGKLGDLDGDYTPVFATKTGYQSGAMKAAEHHGVELLVVREQNETDWASEPGTARVKYIEINITLLGETRIHRFHPCLDLNWVKQNTNIDTRSMVRLEIVDNETFIEDGRESYSLKELARRLDPPDRTIHGRFQEEKQLNDNTYLVHPDLGRVKMLSFLVDYTIYPPLTRRLKIDGPSALMGVIEYVQRGEKKLVFKDGNLENVVTRRIG